MKKYFIILFILSFALPIKADAGAITLGKDTITLDKDYEVEINRETVFVGDEFMQNVFGGLIAYIAHTSIPMNDFFLLVNQGKIPKDTYITVKKRWKMPEIFLTKSLSVLLPAPLRSCVRLNITTLKNNGQKV